MKTILCALDFSEASENIVKQALEMAAQKGNMLVVLYAYRLIQPKGETIADYRNKIEKQARGNFEAIINGLNVNSTVPVDFRTEIGFVSDRIEAYATDNEVDLIVMGQHLAHSINEHRGDTFDTFLETVQRPVLVVPAQAIVG
jgi:nucleotide-binding universal stress UspA family protein